MDEKEVFRRVREMLAGRQAVPAEEIAWDTRLKEDLEVDSLDLVELSMLVEEEYGIELFDEQIGALSTVGDVVRLILDNVSARD
ncbi:MAG: acyl carrier protein [Actinomycetota bacterium]|nr:acyl carrier protein [Actinomycetota bacterium]